MSAKIYSPLISIVTPTFNQAEFIEDCILSIKNQSYKYIEHIIVDGGSTDGTIDIIKKYEGQYNMRWLSEPDNGQADAINKGFSMGHGDIVAWLNSDDFYMYDDVIADVVKLFSKYRSANVVTGKGYYVNRMGGYISPIEIERNKITLKNMKIADYILQPATFVKMTISEKSIINIGYTYTFDWMYFLQIFELNANVLVSDNYFAAYRIYGDNKTALDNAERKLEIAQMALRNFGVFSLQTGFCYFIYCLYKIAEYIPFMRKPLRFLAQLVNSVVHKISCGRYYSC